MRANRQLAHTFLDYVGSHSLFLFASSSFAVSRAV